MVRRPRIGVGASLALFTAAIIPNFAALEGHFFV